MINKKNPFILWLIIVLVIIGCFIAIFVCLRANSVTDVNELAFNEIEMIKSENKVVLKGELVSSGKSYYGYTYCFQDNSLYISIKSGMITRKHTDGSFEIAIENSKISETNKIYVKDRSNMTLIYPQ